MNCLAYALRFWENHPEYVLWYNSGHVINAPLHFENNVYLRAEDFGYDYFKGAFAGLLDGYEEELLDRYFKR